MKKYSVHLKLLPFEVWPKRLCKRKTPEIRILLSNEAICQLIYILVKIIKSSSQFLKPKWLDISLRTLFVYLFLYNIDK